MYTQEEAAAGKLHPGEPLRQGAALGAAAAQAAKSRRGGRRAAGGANKPVDAWPHAKGGGGNQVMRA